MSDSLAVPLPLNEEARLRRVRELEVAKRTQSDPVLARLVRMAADLLQAPIAFITIIEKHQQLFRAQIGLDIDAIPRDLAFCAHTILDTGLFEVSDASQDPRFASNPLVHDSPRLRYYAGYPIVTSDGLGLGSICVGDTRPRAPMDKRQAVMLEHLADLVMLRITNLRITSYIDQPTQLFNRFKLEQDIAETLEAQVPVHLVAVDVISPRALNDVVKAFGYTFANQLMLNIKDTLEALVPNGLSLYKISPTRFGFLLAQRTGDGAVLYDAILESFERPLECEGVPLQISVGIGVLSIDEHTPPDQDNIRLVVGAADTARHERLGWMPYTPAIDQAQQRALSIVSALSTAIYYPGQFSLHYQPKVSLASGHCHSVEALLRWTHPVHGTVSPAEFIPLAEKTALMPTLSLMVARAAVAQASAWRAQGLHMPIAINVSAGDLAGPAFGDALIDLIQAHDLPASAIAIEFTESVLIRSPEAVAQQLRRLKDAGIEIAIDDFGSGYSNWIYLRNLPASTVKIDQSLTRQLRDNEKDQRLVRAIIDLARKTGYKVVAEGIESHTERLMLTAWGCSEGQGYLFARPMPAPQLREWLALQGAMSD